MRSRWSRPSPARPVIVLGLALTAWLAQAPARSASLQAAQQAGGYRGPRAADGKPNLNGIWQVLNSANGDIEAHSARPNVPAGMGVVEGGSIPYQPWALAKKRDNYARRATADPLSKCFLPGVPRATYVPMPFEIIQTPRYTVMAFEIARARRIIYTDGSKHPEALEFWMGDSRGHWEGDTLVVDSVDFNDNTWFDQAGNFHSDALHTVERYTPMDPDHIRYDVTIEDPKVFTRPWKMSMILYRRLDKGLQLLEYDCVSFFWQTVTAGK